MPLITDPDDLNQGSSTAVSDFVIGTTVTSGDKAFTSASNLPALAVNEIFEVRDHSDPLANGLWQVETVTTSTSSYDCNKLSNGALPANAGSEAATTLGATGASTEKSVYLDTLTEEIWLIEQGNLDVAGVTMLALHSFVKEEWKTDQLLIDSGAFPMVGISFAAGQWEFGEDPSGNNSDWSLKVDAGSSTDSVRLIRNAGWNQKNNAGTVVKKFFNVTTLGTFEDTADQAYYFFGDDATLNNTKNYAFANVVNEPVQYYEDIVPADAATGVAITTSNTITRNDAGDFVADGFVVGGQIELSNSEDVGNDGTWDIATVATGAITVDGTPLTNNAADTTMTMAYDNSNAFTTSLRIRDGDAKGKIFQSSTLADAGETAISSKIIKFPLANDADQKIDVTDANVVTGDWLEVRLRYLDAAYNRDVDTDGVARNFGVVIDAGTYSHSNGATATDTSFTSANFALGTGEALADYAGGTITIHEGADKGVHTISGTPTAPGGLLTVVLTSATTATAGTLSFTMNRATPLNVSAQNIYERVQYLLRQATNINDNGEGNVIGKMTGGLAAYVGDSVTFGGAQSTNPNGGGAGVIVEGFDSNDTNNMFFVDNGATTRNFPFVAAGTLNFNTNLTGDTAPEYFLYFQYTARITSATIDCVGNSGSSYDLESDVNVLNDMAVNDYIRISGFAQAANNGLFRITAENVAESDYTVIRVDGQPVGTTETDQTVNVDENPYNSPDAIIVQDNLGADIVGAASTASVSFDFDYDNNAQGGRATEVAVCVLKASGLETGQYVEIPGLQITRATGLSFTATSPLERNYANAA